MPQTSDRPARQRNKNTIMGAGSSIYARIGEIPVTILEVKLHIPRAVAPKRTGKIIG